MIHVIDDWYIEPDELNWQSFEYKKSKNGKHSKRDINYHHDLANAMERIIENCRKKSLERYDGDLKGAIDLVRVRERRCMEKIIEAIQIAVIENKGSKMC